ncbi:P1 family peptidase [Solicola gregarius]|uniref:P1 family peptidase n=1 Tax=Solicola gregarius TaxID=2908642 RepID=A0AA46YMF5_9ACTN|nr:P1 family peptidase [Solicola gregarius]UYM06476.1 P1 family peptidase [Solicola gregarius]
MRATDLGITIGRFDTGPRNAITDVEGVLVGHTTVVADDVRSGVTAVVPEALTTWRTTLPAGLAVGNGHGKLIGATQIDEMGAIETPILLTSTLSAYRVADALVTYMLNLPEHHDTITLNPVVGETNDGFLSDIRSRPIREEHVVAAIESAGREVVEGCVGAGTGTVALGYKGGIGTASRVVDVAGETRTVGALVQSNFGGTLTAAGVRMPAQELLATTPPEPDGNSCMIVVATDAPLDARQLQRVARRAVYAMARVGARYSNSSGDYAIAFGSHGAPPADSALNEIFEGTMDAVEEALLNSLFTAETTYGYRGRAAHAVPTSRYSQP